MTERPIQNKEDFSFFLEKLKAEEGSFLLIKFAEGKVAVLYHSKGSDFIPEDLILEDHFRYMDPVLKIDIEIFYKDIVELKHFSKKPSPPKKPIHPNLAESMRVSGEN